MKKYLSLALFLYSLISQGQNFDRNKMDSLFSRIENNERGMGSISIFNNGSEAYQRSFGFAELNKIKASKDTKYRIGSISKSFTATIIMQMVDDGKLTLETKLESYFPEIPNASTITIEQLLRHRSGLFNFTNAPDYTSWMEKKHTQEELIKKFVSSGTVFKPDEKAEYSNTNYLLLSMIAEKVDKKEFPVILKNRIITPCKLKNTYYGGKIKTKEEEAVSYTKINQWTLAPETDMSVPKGAGAIVSTPTDLNIFFNQLFSGKLVSGESLADMKKIIDGFGMGLFQVPFYERMAFGHTGGIDGFQSMIGYFPDDNVSIAYTSNGVVMPMNDILIGALSIYFGKNYTLPDFQPAIELNSEDLDKYLGVYSSPGFPLKIAITKNGNTLIGQATGQPSFPLEPYETDKFKFDQAMLKLEFKPVENKMILKQRGGEFELKKE